MLSTHIKPDKLYSFTRVIHTLRQMLSIILEHKNAQSKDINHAYKMVKIC